MALSTKTRTQRVSVTLKTRPSLGVSLFPFPIFSSPLLYLTLPRNRTLLFLSPPSLPIYFTKALTLESITKQGHGQVVELPRDVKVRKRKRTPTPSLSEKREKRFREDTRKAREASEKDDRDFVSSRTERNSTVPVQSNRQLREKKRQNYDEGMMAR
jgi:hypothetical protein